MKRELEKKISDLEERSYLLKRVVEENESKINQLKYDISDVQDKVNDHQEVLDNYEYRIWRLERSW